MAMAPQVDSPVMLSAAKHLDAIETDPSLRLRVTQRGIIG